MTGTYSNHQALSFESMSEIRILQCLSAPLVPSFFVKAHSEAKKIEGFKFSKYAKQIFMRILEVSN
jgi:hypothetical protein